MSFLTIRKENQEKKITQLAWDLQGDNHYGWRIASESSQEVSNEVAAMPPTGQVVDNSKIENEVKTSKPAETETETNSQEVSNEVVNSDLPASGTDVPKTENNASESFLEAVKANLKRQDIKNYLDSKKIKYKQNASDVVLAELLSTELLGSVDLLKAEFNLIETK